MLSHWREARASTSRQQQEFVNTPSSSISPAPPTYLVDTPSYLNAAETQDTTTTTKPKLWHSLVLPLVLACVIFLVALWTRQISLALNNDTLMMVMILALLFVFLSGVAFWLSCDHYFHTDPPPPPTQITQQQQQQAHHPHCPLALRLQRQQNDIEAQTTTTTTRHNNCPQAGEKCCREHIAVIDCQPPDYNSALLNSKPISQYLVLYSRNDEELVDNDSLLALRVHFDLNGGDENVDEDDEQRLELPTYEQLQLQLNSTN